MGFGVLTTGLLENDESLKLERRLRGYYLWVLVFLI